jgi:hypothetical protein
MRRALNDPAAFRPRQLAFSVKLFRYRGAAKDGRTLENVFEAGEENSYDC